MKNPNQFLTGLQDQAQAFYESILREAEVKQLNLQGYEMDHLCYRTTTMEEYKITCDKFREVGQLLIESEIGGRLIATFELNEPIVLKDREVAVIEVPAPKKGSNYPLGFEHAEFVISEKLEDYVANNPSVNFDTKDLIKEINPDIRIKFKTGLSIKLHNQTLKSVIEYEKSML